MILLLQLNEQSLIGGLHRIPEGSMACLDTTVLVDLIRPAHRKEHHRAAKLIREMLDQGETLSIARACEAELYVGVHLSTEPNLERERVEQLLSLFVILEFNTAAAKG
jgi:predicted nucleic acid-binding protein